MIIKIVDGDLLTAKEKIIAQQCNCLSTTSFGLSKAVVDKYPWVTVYSIRRRDGRKNYAVESDRDVPGTVKYFTSPQETKTIACMFGQWSQGKFARKGFPTTYKDTKKDRLEYFKSCLESLEDYAGDERIAMPYGIGCGLAGGDWLKYSEMLEKSKLNIVLYKI